MRLRVGGLVAVLTAALAACGGGGDEAAPATESVSVTAPDAVETTGVPTTSASTTTTTSPPTAEPTTTRAPTTTIDPAEVFAAEVEADFRRARELELLASMDPTDEEAVDAALDARIGPDREALADYFEELLSHGRAIRPNPLVVGSTTIESPAGLVLEDSGVVELQECEVDPWILVEVTGAPDGSDAIVDDGVYAYRRVVILRMTDDGWRIEGARILGQWSGATECPEL